MTVVIEIEDDELGDYVLLGSEGIDNDGDGQVNEDTVGYVDPNRTWGYFWQPSYVQSGAGDYPLQIPETRSIALWALDHPNMGALQSYHNSGKMILRGPGAKMAPAYPGSDVAVYDLIGKEGERLLPGYTYMIVWKDLYTVYGGTTDHFYSIHGAIALTNELYDEPADFDDDGSVSDEERMKFNDLHASQLPKLSFGEPEVTRLSDGLWRLELPVLNERAIPTMTAMAQKNRLHRPDLATVAGATVVASGVVDDPWLDKVSVQEHRPERLAVPGVDGRSTRRLFFLLSGRGEVTVTYDSVKGGKITTTVPLR